MKLKGNLFNDSRGFTLIETLVALVINALVLLLVSLTFQTLLKAEKEIHRSENIEWHLFLNQVERDLVDKTLKQRVNIELQFDIKDSLDTYAYKFTGSEIKRFKNDTGYNPLLTEVKNVLFKDSDSKKSITIYAEFKNGQTMKGNVRVERKK